MIGKILKTGLVVLIAIGVARGIIHYNNATDGAGVERLLFAIVHAAEDITYQWIGPTVDFIADLAESLSGSAS